MQLKGCVWHEMWLNTPNDRVKLCDLSSFYKQKYSNLVLRR